VENLWISKALLTGFEITSGLKVKNFLKSCLIGVNVPSDLMSMACNFLNCCEETLPFKYLGLLVGANPKSMPTWEPLLEKLRRKFNSWGNRHISLGGRIVLLNAVLNLIPKFYLSYLKMSVNVCTLIVNIQREIL